MRQDDHSVHLARVSEANELVVRPVDVVIFNLPPFGLVLHLATPQSVDTNKENTVHGEGKILLSHWLIADVELGVPVGVEAMEGIFPILKALFVVGKVIVAIVQQFQREW